MLVVRYFGIDLVRRTGGRLQTMKLTLVLACAFCLMLASCTTTLDRVNNLSQGMTKAEAVKVLGQPYMTMSPGYGVEILQYRLRRTRYPLKVPLTYDYIVRLVDGRVVAYGKPDDLNVKLDPRERTVNVHVRSETTNAVAPVQPNVNISPP